MINEYLTNSLRQAIIERFPEIKSLHVGVERGGFTISFDDKSVNKEQVLNYINEAICHFKAEFK